MAPIKSPTLGPDWLSPLLALRRSTPGRVQTAAMTDKNKTANLAARSKVDDIKDINDACQRKKGGCKFA